MRRDETTTGETSIVKISEVIVAQLVPGLSPSFALSASEVSASLESLLLFILNFLRVLVVATFAATRFIW